MMIKLIFGLCVLFLGGGFWLLGLWYDVCKVKLLGVLSCNIKGFV